MNITGIGANSVNYSQQLQQANAQHSQAASLNRDHDNDVDTGGSDTNDGKGKYVNVKA